MRVILPLSCCFCTLSGRRHLFYALTLCFKLCHPLSHRLFIGSVSEVSAYTVVHANTRTNPASLRSIRKKCYVQRTVKTQNDRGMVAMKIQNTFVLCAEDCPVDHAVVPQGKVRQADRWRP